MNNHQSQLINDNSLLEQIAIEMDKLFDLREKLGSPIPRETY